MSTIHASVWRKNRFEFVSLRQGPNSFAVTMSMRDVSTKGFAPAPLDLNESRFTDEQMTKIHAALDIIEQVYGDAYGEHETSVAGAIDATNQAVQARAMTAEAELKLNVQRDEAMKLAAHLDEMMAAKAKLEEQHAALDATLALKRAVAATQEKSDG